MSRISPYIVLVLLALLPTPEILAAECENGLATLEPIDDDAVDGDLWAILGWMISGVGAPWTVGDLQETGRLYRIPAASTGS